MVHLHPSLLLKGEATIASKTMGIEQVEALLLAPGFQKIAGWCSPDKGCRMARLVQECETPPLIVELGVFGGRSLVALGLGVKYTQNDQGRVDGIDPYTAAASLEGTNDKANDVWWGAVDYEKTYRDAKATIEHYGLAGTVRIIRARSQDVSGGYSDRSISICHQDSNHSSEVSCDEVERWTPKMIPGGYWVMDDINWATTEKAQMLLIDKGFSWHYRAESWGIYRAPFHP